MNLNNIKNKLERYKGQYLSIKEQLTQQKEKAEKIGIDIIELEKARVIIQEVSKLTQQEIEFHISDIVTHGLAAIFNNPYKYKLSYVTRRNKTEADQQWIKGNNTFLPNGGGVRDVSAFALHVACTILFLLQKQNIRPVLFMDEPFKHLKPSSLQERAGMLLQEMSADLNMQIILITHDEVLSNKMDNVIKIVMDKGVSYAECTEKI